MQQGRTRVLCTATLSEDCPPWIQTDADGRPVHGWVTAEYAMLPGSTSQRKRRGADSRSTEIQRLIGRSLRAAVDLKKMAGFIIHCDCDVLLADGGTRTASVTGAFVAMAQAVEVARKEERMKLDPIDGPIAAISVGLVHQKPVLDLDYALDVSADVDLNVVMNHLGQFVELQGTGERSVFSRDQLSEMLELAAGGIERLIQYQREAIKELVSSLHRS